jgi:hypothetical protein
VYTGTNAQPQVCVRRAATPAAFHSPPSRAPDEIERRALLKLPYTNPAATPATSLRNATMAERRSRLREQSRNSMALVKKLLQVMDTEYGGSRCCREVLGCRADARILPGLFHRRAHGTDGGQGYSGYYDAIVAACSYTESRRASGVCSETPRGLSEAGHEWQMIQRQN